MRTENPRICYLSSIFSPFSRCIPLRIPFFLFIMSEINSWVDFKPYILKNKKSSLSFLFPRPIPSLPGNVRRHFENDVISIFNSMTRTSSPRGEIITNRLGEFLKVDINIDFQGDFF